jgi:hypothetical protein
VWNGDSIEDRAAIEGGVRGQSEASMVDLNGLALWTGNAPKGSAPAVHS